MNFWNRVIEELKYQGKTRKWLAAAAKLDASTIGTGVKRDSIPNADMAWRISKVLNVPIEYLLYGKTENLKSENLLLFHKYEKIITSLEKMPNKLRTPIMDMIEKINSKS